MKGREAAAHFGVSLNYIYQMAHLEKKKNLKAGLQRSAAGGGSASAKSRAEAPADPRLERIRAALAEAEQGKETKVAIAKKYGMSYFTFTYYWKRKREGKPLPTGGGGRRAVTAAASTPLPPPPPPPPPPPSAPSVDPASVSDTMRKAIGAVILGKMCVKAASSLHRVPFVQLKSLCQSLTARYDSKGAVLLELADSGAAEAGAGGTAPPQPPPPPPLVRKPISVNEEALSQLKPKMQAAVRAVLGGMSRKRASVLHGVCRQTMRKKLLRLGVNLTGKLSAQDSRSQTEAETEADTEPEPGPESESEPAAPGPAVEPDLTGVRPQMAAAVRSVLAGTPMEKAAADNNVLVYKLRQVIKNRGLTPGRAPAVNKLKLMRTAGGYQVTLPASTSAAGAAAKEGLPLREAVERVLLLGETVTAVAGSSGLAEKLLEGHCHPRQPVSPPQPQPPSVRDEMFVIYTALALCDAGWDINVDSLRWMFEQFVEKSGQSAAPSVDDTELDWLRLPAIYSRWPELRDQISTEPGSPTAQFETAFLDALHGVCDEFELKLGALVLHDAESARRRKSREVLPLPVAAEPPPGHVWDNRNGSWILEKDGKQQAFFEVETILAKRDGAAGQPEYLIRWKGYSE